MSDGGKGSSPRPFSVSQSEYDKRWELIFSKNKKQTQEFDQSVTKNEYYDFLSTEDCLTDDNLNAKI